MFRREGDHAPGEASGLFITTRSGTPDAELQDSKSPPKAIPSPFMTGGSPAPPGWDYNPSSWGQRLPIVGLATVGFFVAAYLAGYQLDMVGDVWEPFFGNGSRKILNSKISHLFPVPDAALGAIGYLADAVTGVIGSKTRWRKMPWIVIIFGLAVGPLGAASILLVILQPVLFDAFCTLCLASAVISVVMIGPAMDELLASLQYLKSRRREGGSLWRAFWGTDPQQASEDLDRLRGLD